MQQERLWATEPDGPSPVVQHTAPLGTASVDSVLVAVPGALERHEAFRTSFSRVTGMSLPLQEVNDPGPDDVAVVDGDAGSVAQEQRRAPFDPLEGPLLRIRLVNGAEPALILTASALVADLASLALLAGELLGGTPVDKEPVQYADYAAWQAEQLEEGGEGVLWWENCRLAGTPAPALGFLGDAEPELAAVPVAPAAVEALAAAAGTSVDSVWLAAWAAVVARLVLADELLVGVEDPGRASEELAGASGPFARLLAVRAGTDVDDTLATLAASLERTVEAAHQHADLASPSTTGLPANTELPVTFARRPNDGLVEHAGERVALALHDGAATVRAPGAAATILADALGAALSGADATTRLGDLALCATGDAAVAAATVTGPASPAPTGTTIEMVLSHAATAPDTVAVVGADATLTYGDLDARTAEIAAALRPHGARPGAVVGVLFDRSAAQVAAVLGVLRTGAAYLPLHVEHPDSRIEFLLADASAVAVVTDAAGAARLPTGVPCVTLPLAQGAASDAAVTAAGADDPAYVIYTSGSTGEPKGVLVRNGGLANYTQDLVSRLGLDAGPQQVGLVTSLSTDLGNTALFPTLASGGTVHVLSTETATDPAAYAAYVAGSPLDVVKITPSHLGALLGLEGDQVLPRRLLVLGGEAAPWALVDRVAAAGRCAVLNHYGPTETTIGSLTFPLEGATAEQRGAPVVPVGRPIANTYVRLLDRALRPVPQGMPGEVCIGGAGLATGYLNRPDQTAERFIADPFGPGSLYRTGDLGRLTTDGTVAFLGRADSQVKVRGYRVEVAEIEQVALRHAGVQHAAVVLREDTPGDARLVLYAVPEDGAALDELRLWLGERLPDYMVPNAVVTLQALPMTPNGKLDKRALPAPVPGGGAGRSVTPPSSDTERAIAEIWCDVLGEEEVGVDEGFFALGGHSLLATQVIARIRTLFDVQLPLHIIFTASTVEALAAEVDRQRGEAGDDDELAKALAELDELSDEEAAALLAEELDGDGA